MCDETFAPRFFNEKQTWYLKSVKDLWSRWSNTHTLSHTPSNTERSLFSYQVWVTNFKGLQMLVKSKPVSKTKELSDVCIYRRRIRVKIRVKPSRRWSRTYCTLTVILTMGDRGGGDKGRGLRWSWKMVKTRWEEVMGAYSCSCFSFRIKNYDSLWTWRKSEGNNWPNKFSCCHLQILQAKWHQTQARSQTNHGSSSQTKVLNVY